MLNLYLLLELGGFAQSAARKKGKQAIRQLGERQYHDQDRDKDKDKDKKKDKGDKDKK